MGLLCRLSPTAGAPIDAILHRFRNRRIVLGNFPSDAANRETGKARGARPEVRKFAR
jgi:hypothetical protein